ncbi:hypothetical protein PROFUN_11862 [Planoprotostelium fungivorum]|uniref:Cytidine deaminase n=1 Tax=Planoprotostelium fungivorum TaxID=1890364 RepID=A0A2P6N9D1_9EUKA|nr:hypothetical protein PROFUN_11862 [Planoprotostelium fungivorum]
MEVTTIVLAHSRITAQFAQSCLCESIRFAIRLVKQPTYMANTSLTPEQLEKLIDLSFSAKTRAHAPYSKFRVGACLLTQSGEFITGCNVENSSYGLSICAERTALVKAVSEGHTNFRAIAVSSDLVDNHISPCGACRQFISEFGLMDIYLMKPDRTYIKTDTDALLPFRFTGEQLDGKKIQLEEQ